MSILLAKGMQSECRVETSGNEPMENLEMGSQLGPMQAGLGFRAVPTCVTPGFQVKDQGRP